MARKSIHLLIDVMCGNNRAYSETSSYEYSTVSSSYLTDSSDVKYVPAKYPGKLLVHILFLQQIY